ncbi:carbon starvation protein A, partial [bacterium]|nr:carbon starvation protein A [bacterium]
MQSILIVIVTFFLYIIAYHTYGKFLRNKIFNVDINAKPPSHTMRDDIDFVPTRKEILFGHHYASIAGTGPIVGPAIGVFWGWVPALIWVVFGSIFMGAVHDYGVLILSMRNQGRSIGDITGDIINPRMRILFLSIIYFLILLVLAVFLMVIASIFDLFPESVLPIWLQIPIAIGLGFAIRNSRRSPYILGFFAAFLMYLTIVIGSYFPIVMPTILGIPPLTTWCIILLVYCYIASVIPVWQLLQPRDFINAYQLIIALGLLTLGVFAARPEIIAPAYKPHPSGAPPIFPFLFVTIACGAISGFHALVSSGTSPKQIDNEGDAQFVGYGAMLLEGVLAILVIIAVCGGLGMAHLTSKG